MFDPRRKYRFSAELYAQYNPFLFKDNSRRRLMIQGLDNHPVDGGYIGAFKVDPRWCTEQIPYTLKAATRDIVRDILQEGR